MTALTAALITFWMMTGLNILWAYHNFKLTKKLKRVASKFVTDMLQSGKMKIFSEDVHINDETDFHSTIN